MPRERPSTSTDPAIEFMQSMWAVDHELQRVSKRMEAAIGLTGPQRFALVLISRFPGVAAGILAAHLHLHPGTVTGIIARRSGAESHSGVLGCRPRRGARSSPAPHRGASYRHGRTARRIAAHRHATDAGQREVNPTVRSPQVLTASRRASSGSCCTCRADPSSPRNVRRVCFDRADRISGSRSSCHS
jgi:hypothetical protein